MNLASISVAYLKIQFANSIPPTESLFFCREELYNSVSVLDSDKLFEDQIGMRQYFNVCSKSKDFIANAGYYYTRFHDLSSFSEHFRLLLGKVTLCRPKIQLTVSPSPFVEVEIRHQCQNCCHEGDVYECDACHDCWHFSCICESSRQGIDSDQWRCPNCVLEDINKRIASSPANSPSGSPLVLPSPMRRKRNAAGDEADGPTKHARSLPKEQEIDSGGNQTRHLQNN